MALQRGMTREGTVDQRQLPEPEMREVMDRHATHTDQPGDDEKVIKIDGTIPFEQQYESFKAQLAEITHE